MKLKQLALLAGLVFTSLLASAHNGNDGWVDATGYQLWRTINRELINLILPVTAFKDPI